MVSASRAPVSSISIRSRTSARKPEGSPRLSVSVERCRRLATQRPAPASFLGAALSGTTAAATGRCPFLRPAVAISVSVSALDSGATVQCRGSRRGPSASASVAAQAPVSHVSAGGGVGPVRAGPSAGTVLVAVCERATLKAGTRLHVVHAGDVVWKPVWAPEASQRTTGSSRADPPGGGPSPQALRRQEESRVGGALPCTTGSAAGAGLTWYAGDPRPRARLAEGRRLERLR